MSRSWRPGGPEPLVKGVLGNIYAVKLSYEFSPAENGKNKIRYEKESSKMIVKEA